MRLKIMVLRSMAEVELHQQSESCWLVTGTYRGENIETTGSDKGPALHAWKEAATARACRANRYNLGGGSSDALANSATKTILVCDDDPLLVDIVRFRLTSREYAVEVARDGVEALARIKNALPDAIVLDSMMPVMDGLEVLRQLREDSQTRDIPVIMLSARKQEADVVGALELGAADYMVKPFSPEELVARLTRLLEESK